MSTEPSPPTEEGASCPACQASQPPRIVDRPPLVLRFCGRCGLLRAAQPAQRQHTAASPLPVSVLTLRPTTAEPPAGAAGSSPGALPEPAPERPRPTPPPSLEPGFAYPHVLLGDASGAFRDAARDALLVSGLAEEVTCAKDGAQLLTEFTRACRRGTTPSLVVLDAALPLLDGKNVAILLRGIEDAFALRPMPILFYAAATAGPSLAPVLAYLKQARHLPRDSQAPPAEQVRQLVAGLAAPP
ncbi:MAG: hypothetical protein RBU45_06680 [Myxococcota bacterium]|jgi:CheY-like chemotaxis protein|nr:hypothetical protein [Myxococcota bacterium]